MKDDYEKTLALLQYLRRVCPDCLTVAEFSCDKIGFNVPAEFSLETVSCLAKFMALHIGLREGHFIFETSKAVDYAAGWINLKEQLGFTKITISEELLRFPSSLMMVLAHELTHKYLHAHAVQLSDTGENERMTDVASVCLGFGKMILNGKHYRVNTEKGLRDVTIGYLNDTEFALAYDIVCSQKAICENKILENLTCYATKSLWDARIKYRDKYPKIVVAARTVQANLENIALMISECERMAPDVHRVNLLDIGNWLEHLKSQLPLVISSDDERFVMEYVKQVEACEKRAQEIFNTLGSRSSWLVFAKKTVGAINQFTFHLFKGFYNRLIRPYKCYQRSVATRFGHQLGSQMPEALRPMSCDTSERRSYSYGPYNLKTPIVGFDQYRAIATPISRTVYSISVNKVFWNRDEAESCLGACLKYMRSLAHVKPNGASDPKVVNFDEQGYYVAIKCSHSDRWGSHVSMCFRNHFLDDLASSEISKVCEEDMAEHIESIIRKKCGSDIQVLRKDVAENAG